MLRHEPKPQPASVSDRELGIAAALLLLVILLTTVFVPGIV